MRPVALAIALLAVCAGCTSPDRAVPWEGDATPSESADLVRLHQAKAMLDYAWERKRVVDIEKVITEDVVLMPPHEPVQIGRKVAGDWLREWMRPLLMRDTYVSEAFDVAGPFAVETWTVDRLVTEGEAQRRVRLKGIHIYRRQPNGWFLLERRIWNLSPEHGADQDLR